jgi:hypothetical protein
VKRRVLDELGADLALALAIDDKYDYSNKYWQYAKYRWTAPDFDDYGEAFDWVQSWLCRQRNVSSPNWRMLLQMKGIWQGGIRTNDPQPTKSAVLPFCRWILLNGLRQDKILDRYDRFVITRSDFVWSCPHPPLSILDRDLIWVPNGEEWGGLPDRHLIASRENVVTCLNMLEDMLLQPESFYEELRQRPATNNEQFFLRHLERKGLIDKVRRFPYVMYTARDKKDYSPTFSPGRYEPTVGHFVKYPGEFASATAYATIIHDRRDWESRAWIEFDSSSRRPISFWTRLRDALQGGYYNVISAVRRPGRLTRFMRFIRGENPRQFW